MHLVGAAGGVQASAAEEAVDDGVPVTGELAGVLLADPVVKWEVLGTGFGLPSALRPVGRQPLPSGG